MKIITEAIDNESLELVEQYADVIQIGARNMQNFSLLKRAGRAKKPVMVKRGMSATLEEFLMAAEYVMSEGNYNVVFCERGVRTFADHTRNTLDLSIVPAVQRLSHLADRGRSQPWDRQAQQSYAAFPRRDSGRRGWVDRRSHYQPDKAFSDGMQSLFPEQFDELMTQVRQIAAVVGREIVPIGSREMLAGSLAQSGKQPVIAR